MQMGEYEWFLKALKIYISEDKWQVNRNRFIKWLICSKLKLQSRLDHYIDSSQIKPAGIILPTSYWEGREHRLKAQSRTASVTSAGGEVGAAGSIRQ